MSRTTNQPISITRRALGARKPTLWIGLVVCLIAAPVHASRIVQIRVGNHATFTRLVFEMDTPAGYQVERHATADGGERLVVTLDASSRSRTIQSKSAGIESVVVEERSSKAVAQIHLRKPGLPMKEMILSNPPRIVLDFELPVVAATTPKRPAAVQPQAKAVKPKTSKLSPQKVVAKPLPKAEPLPEPVAVKLAPKSEPVAIKPAPKPELVAIKPAPKPVVPVIAAVDSVPTPADEIKAAGDEEHRAAVRAMTPGVHKRDGMASEPAPESESAAPSDPIEDMNVVAGVPGRRDSVEPEAKPAPDRAARSAAQASIEKRNQQKKKLRSAARSAPAPKEPPVNMAVIAAIVGAVLIAAVLVVRRIRKRSIASALDVVALAEEAELDAGPAAANESVDERIPVKGFSMDGDSRAIEPSLRGAEENTAAYSVSEVAANETEPESGLYSEDPEGEKRMDLEATDMPVESGEFNVSPSIMTGGDTDTSQLVQELATRIANLETRLDEASEARERLERQVAAQSEELRVQRAAIARTQRALRSLGRSEAEQATEPALRDPAKQADSPA